jgi:hypothetical protein
MAKNQPHIEAGVKTDGEAFVNNKRVVQKKLNPKDIFSPI